MTDYICHTLRNAGLEVEIRPLTERRFLNIKHLCTPIDARGDVSIPELMSALSPTPAVAGYPRERAIGEIGRVETHRRHCYGGYVGVRIGGDYHAFVNLRCAFMAPVILSGTKGWLGNLYAGGGIIAASQEDAEWLETESKTESLHRSSLVKTGRKARKALGSPELGLISLGSAPSGHDDGQLVNSAGI